MSSFFGGQKVYPAVLLKTFISIDIQYEGLYSKKITKYLGIIESTSTKGLKFRKSFYQNSGNRIIKTLEGFFKSVKLFQRQRKLRFECAETNNVEDSFDRTARWWEFFGCNKSLKTANFFLRSPQSGKPCIQQGSS